MAHCPYRLLADLEGLLDEIRNWPNIVERRPGIFYLKRTPFLHFHLQQGMRSADVRAGKNWGPTISVPIGAGRNTQKQILSEVKQRYRATAAAVRTKVAT
jgi:hypothetical protein